MAASAARAEEEAADAPKAAEAVEPGEAAESPAKTLTLSLDYKGDVMGVVSGGEERGARYVDKLVVSADLDLDRAVGLKGASAHLDMMDSFGRNISDLAGSALGLDGNEVDANRFRIPQVWVQQTFASQRASILLGFYDLGSEFNTAESSRLFLGITSDMSSELAASGLNGPSADPETALALRLRVQPTKNTYAQLMAANAHASAIGDPGGPDFGFHDGLLIAGEIGYTATGKIALGAWRYTRRLPDLRELTGGGDPVLRTSQGLYAIVERPLNDPKDGVRKLTAFVKAGLSDGKTTAFSASWNAGLLLEHVFKTRPDSALALGASQGRFTGRFRDNSRDEGLAIGGTETDVELTYTDRIAPHLMIQPDLQWVVSPSGDASLRNAVVIGVRFRLTL
jgi:porin